MKIFEVIEMHKFMLVVSLVVFAKCEANENKLEGTWRMDPQRSLKELNIPKTESVDLDLAATKVLQLFEMYANEECAALRVVYGKSTYRTILNGDVRNSTVAPYRVIESDADYVVIDQFDNGGILKINFVENSFYVNQSVGGFKYKDYFTKTPCMTSSQRDQSIN